MGRWHGWGGQVGRGGVALASRQATILWTDEIHFSHRLSEPGNDDSLVNTKKMVSYGFKVVRTDFVHPQSGCISFYLRKNVYFISPS